MQRAQQKVFLVAMWKILSMHVIGKSEWWKDSLIDDFIFDARS
jgi:hypothetical protein